MENLQRFSEMVEKWNKSINLVSKLGEDDIFQRHVLDSLQIVQHVQFGETWVDFGSGGGFPGVVLAIAAKELNPDTQFTFVESDKRKCAFLTAVIAEFKLNAKPIPKRIEQIDPIRASHISARALAPLDVLLGYSLPHFGPNTLAVFPKGATHKEELDKAQKQWNFDCDLIKSSTNPDAALLMVRNLSKCP
ncbi:MAG: 16S rRNA (guanine(527)-N(7))-methyltransferase RsmG [Planktomarina sp.]